MSNVEEIKARGGPVIAVVCEGDREVGRLADDLIEVPAVEEFLQPIITVIPLQLLAYYIAVARGCDVDKPRNLAKSVTVEYRDFLGKLDRRPAVGHGQLRFQRLAGQRHRDRRGLRAGNRQQAQASSTPACPSGRQPRPCGGRRRPSARMSPSLPPW